MSLPFLSEIAWKGTLVLAAAFAGSMLWRRRSAGLRHFLWTVSFAALLLLPAAALLIPRWTPSVVPLPTEVAFVTTTAASSGPAAPPSRPILPLIWMVGFSLAFAWFLVGAVRTAIIVRRAGLARHAAPALLDLCRALNIRRRVRVLETRAIPIPLTWGLARPVVILPANSKEWPANRREAVLLHELVHVLRFDVLAQTIGQAACCFYWFHPLAWLALRQLRREREHACDDAVLMRGLIDHEYAGHLMDLVRGLPARRNPINAPAIAEASDLETRVRALLDRGRNRSPLSRSAAVAIAVAVVAVLLPIAAITAHAQADAGALAGIVTDVSRARVPNTQVTARSLTGPNVEVTKANQAGEYRFASLAPGRYSIEFASPGFALTKVEVEVVSGKPGRVDATLNLGSVKENVTVTGRKPPTVSVSTNTTPQRIPIGGNVTPAKLLKQVRPVYPAELQQLGIEGTVIIRAVVGTQGDILNPEVISTNVDSRLAAAALDAVRQWRYQPTLLNGQPVEMATTINIDFQLSQ